MNDKQLQLLNDIFGNIKNKLNPNKVFWQKSARSEQQLAKAPVSEVVFLFEVVHLA